MKKRKLVRKKLWTRLFSSVTATLMSASVALGSFPGLETALSASAEAELGGGIFALNDSGENGLDALRNNRQWTNSLSAAINFKNADGSTNTNADIPWNTYYLLVHVEGKNSDSWDYAAHQDVPVDTYKLYNINAGNGGVWSTGEFGDIVESINMGGGRYSSPDGKKIEGFIVKSNNTWVNSDQLLEWILSDDDTA